MRGVQVKDFYRSNLLQKPNHSQSLILFPVFVTRQPFSQRRLGTSIYCTVVDAAIMPGKNYTADHRRVLSAKSFQCKPNAKSVSQSFQIYKISNLLLQYCSSPANTNKIRIRVTVNFINSDSKPP